MSMPQRVFAALICLLVVTLAVTVIVLAWTLPQETIDWLGGAVEWMDDNDGAVERLLLSSAAAAIGLLALALVVLQVLPAKGRAVRVVDLKAGDAVLSSADIALRVEEAVRRVPQVNGARAEVRARRKGVLVGLDLYVEPDANLAAVTDAACQAAQDVLNDKVHVALQAPPSVRLHYREPRPGVRAPAAAREAPRRIVVPIGAGDHPPADQARDADEPDGGGDSPQAKPPVNGPAEPQPL
jgi:hypothetical protein